MNPIPGRVGLLASQTVQEPQPLPECKAGAWPDFLPVRSLSTKGPHPTPAPTPEFRLEVKQGIPYPGG